MVPEFRIVSARRSYEYPADAILLSLLTNQGVIQHIRNSFSFEVAVASVPMPTFGPVSNTIPPGLVFDYGILPYREESAVAIRFLHVEQRRIVIDVAGPSEAIDFVFGRLKEILKDLSNPDGLKAIGDEPSNVLDYSDIRFEAPVDPQILLPVGIRSIYSQYLRQSEDISIVPALSILRLRPEDEYPGRGSDDHLTTRLELRMGTKVGELAYFSGAPLPTKEHQQMLSEIVKTLQ